MIEKGVEFVEEEDVVGERMDAQNEKEYSAILGAIIRMTGLSEQRARLSIVLLSLTFFAIAGMIFASGFFDKNQNNTLEEQIQNTRALETTTNKR